MNATPGRFVYLPIEITVRELDAKLLVAMAALGSGFEVIIGQKWLLEKNISRMPPGLILSKTLTKRDSRAIEKAKQCGYVTAAIDEEMPGLIATQQGLRWVDAGAVAATDLFLCVGENHRQAMVAKFPEIAGRCRLVGNPRWDLLYAGLREHYRPLAEELRGRYGRFILVNTNSGIVNSAKGSPEKVLESHIRWGKVDLSSEEETRSLEDRRIFREANFAGMKEVMRRLPERFPEHQFVLRPHPNEAVDTWHEFLRDVPRFSIEQQHPAAPWIMAAEALVHTSCTTGVEAYALDRPAICLEPVETEAMRNYLANRINFVAKSVDETLDRVQAHLRPSFTSTGYPHAFATEYARFFTVLPGEMAAAGVIRECAALLPKAPARIGRKARWRPKPKFKREIEMKPHNRKLMPPMSVAEVESQLRRLAAIAGMSSAIEGLRVVACGDNLFHLHRSKWGVRYWTGALARLNRLSLPRPF